jgi:hypothetical protein
VTPQINNRFSENTTLLLFATYMNNPAAAAVLFKAGADPLIKSRGDNDGYNYFQLVTDLTRRHPSLRPGGPQFHQLSVDEQVLFNKEENRIVAAFVQGYFDAGGDPSITYAAGTRNNEPNKVTWANELAVMKYYAQSVYWYKLGWILG